MAVKGKTKNWFLSRTWLIAIKGLVVYEYLQEILPKLRMLFKIFSRGGDLEKMFHWINFWTSWILKAKLNT